MLCREHFRDRSEDQVPSCLTSASSPSKLGPLRHCPVDVHVQREGRWGGALGRRGAGEGGSAGWSLPKGLLILCPRCPQTHLTCNVDGQEDPGQRQHGKYALRRTRSRLGRQAPQGSCAPSRDLVCSASASVRLLLAESLTLPGRHISMFKWERG